MKLFLATFMLLGAFFVMKDVHAMGCAGEVVEEPVFSVELTKTSFTLPTETLKTSETKTLEHSQKLSLNQVDLSTTNLHIGIRILDNPCSKTDFRTILTVYRINDSTDESLQEFICGEEYEFIPVPTNLYQNDTVELKVDLLFEFLFTSTEAIPSVITGEIGLFDIDYSAKN